ncbi:MAG: hypothetical protein AAF533_18885 [Acidobacteriota bacterium]
MTERRRFTLRGGPELEDRLHDAEATLAARLGEALDPDEHDGVLMIGGYGRGEGGVERRDGQEHPHNNLDLLVLVEEPPGRTEEIRQRATAAVQPVVEEIGIGIDVGAIAVSALRRAPCHVMWHDMRLGHRVVLGPAKVLGDLEHLTADRLLTSDVLTLLVNRGTLILINDLLLAQGEPDEHGRRTVIKHAVKAIIGYGDALLHSLDRYHWSYAEKQRRMAAATEIPEDFRATYDEAAEFRFEPSYERFAGRDLAAWMDELRTQVQPLHLRFESWRLGETLESWEGYAERAARSALLGEIDGPKALARRVWRFTRSDPAPSGSLGFKLGFRAAGERGRLAFLFPAASYAPADAPGYLAQAREALGVSGDDPDDLRRSYLARWSSAGDLNSGPVLQALGLSPDRDAEGADS